MKEKTAFDLLLGFLTIILFYITYMMFAPFLLAIFWAFVFSLAFYPLYLLVLRRIRKKDLAALIVILISFLVIMGPLSYVSYLLISDVKQLVGQLGSGGGAGTFLGITTEKVVDKVAGALDLNSAEIRNAISEAMANVRKSIIEVINTNVFTVINAVVDYFLILFTMFFLLKDGGSFVENIGRYIPMTAGQRLRFIERTKEVIVATLYGGVLLGVLQGIIGGVSFYLLGMRSAVLLGFLIFLFSFVPIVGTFAVWGPVCLYFLITGSLGKGIIVAAIGVVIFVGVVDHFLKPLIIGGRAKIHTLLVFFGVLGGMHLFGIIGFVAGPLIVAILMLSLDMINSELQEREARGGRRARKEV